MSTLPKMPGPSAELIEIRRESWRYAGSKPGRIPPADSATRPALARLWKAGETAVTRDPKARAFEYAGWQFAIAYAAGHLVVMDWHSQHLLVRPPVSADRLRRIVAYGAEP